MPARRPVLSAILLVAGLTLPPAAAAAQDAGAAVVLPAAEIASLEAELTREAAQLSSGCAVACPALASMERTAERICALDPGPRCAEARAKVKDAARRVQLACGECGTPKSLEEKPRSSQKKSAGGDLRLPDGEARDEMDKGEAFRRQGQPTATKGAPVSVNEQEMVAAAPRHGGCAGCVVASDDQGAAGAGALAAIAAVVQLARRRARRRRR